ncbi:MAG: cytochrome c-type biogenesis protein CcmH [Acidimicrobiales bacterium]|jgi:cytochrome c-type biogenesis protein CcmH
MRQRQVGWVVVVLAAIGLLTFAAVDDTGPRNDAERVQALSSSFACPECDGQSVAESNAAVAANIREDIRLEVASGATDREIRDRLVRSYGTDVLLTPPSDGISLLVWLLPVLVVVVGSAGVAAVIFGRGDGTRTASVDDAALVASARRSALNGNAATGGSTDIDEDGSDGS